MLKEGSLNKLRKKIDEILSLGKSKFNSRAEMLKWSGYKNILFSDFVEVNSLKFA